MTAETASRIGHGARRVLARWRLPREVADEIVQETVLRILRYEVVGNPDGMGQVVARRLACDHWRREHLTRPGDEPNGWSALWPQEIVVQIHQQMAGLPDHHRPNIEDFLYGPETSNAATQKRRNRAIQALRDAA